MEKVSKARKRIIFRLTATEAAEVSIGGDFNNWNAQKHLLRRKPGGIWEAAVMLPPGQYEYKFKVDEVWCNDPANNHMCDNPFGTRNNVLSVEDRK